MTETPWPLALIAAVARNGVIGADNALPWRLSSDMRHFKALTLGQPVLMGRKTWESIGRPLPGRAVIVVSRSAGFAAPGALVAGTVEAALTQAAIAARQMAAREILVAGGGMLYRSLMDRADRLYVTEVDAAPQGDTLFPPIDPATWRVASRETPSRGANDDCAFTFVTYERL